LSRGHTSLPTTKKTRPRQAASKGLSKGLALQRPNGRCAGHPGH
jgi:hypothetical protein